MPCMDMEIPNYIFVVVVVLSFRSTFLQLMNTACTQFTSNMQTVYKYSKLCLNAIVNHTVFYQWISIFAIKQHKIKIYTD